MLQELEKLEGNLMHCEMSLQQKLHEGTEVFNERVQQNYKSSKDFALHYFEDVNTFIEDYNIGLRNFAFEQHEKIIADYEAKMEQQEKN